MEQITAKECSICGLTKDKKYTVINKTIDKLNNNNLLFKIIDDSGKEVEWSYMWFKEYESYSRCEQHEKQIQSNVNHPAHYGGRDNVYETIKIIRHHRLGFCLGNALKYIIRAGKKDESKYIEDLEKAVWYIQYKINELKKEKNEQ